MASELSKEEIINELRVFKTRRENLLHEDESTFDHQLDRFIECCHSNRLIRLVVEPLEPKLDLNVDEWLENSYQRNAKLAFPSNPDQELILRYRIIEKAASNERLITSFGIARGARKRAEWISLFLSLIVRPFLDELTHKVGEVVNLASPEARAVQAVPFARIPGPNETKIFLSHKTVDKPLVYRYYDALRQVGFDPWLDDPNMAAGADLVTEIVRGFEESCAAVFFLTENFAEEDHLATEIQHAVAQKRKKEGKFAIITLRYPNAPPIPQLLLPYIHKEVDNDLQGFRELVRGLPLELGPPRWKAEVV